MVGDLHEKSTNQMRGAFVVLGCVGWCGKLIYQARSVGLEQNQLSSRILLVFKD